MRGKGEKTWSEIPPLQLAVCIRPLIRESLAAAVASFCPTSYVRVLLLFFFLETLCPLSTINPRGS